MKSLKRSLVFLVVFAMVLSTVAPVFAATPTDVVGTDYEEAVGKLVALGVIAGYEDGTYKPDQDITRAEFAKIAVYVLGMQTAAELAKGATKFSDVAADHWATGYINIASDKGLIKGYGDKTFKPEAKITYAEAITILVRALGMGPVVEGKGTWPANYLAEAAKAGVTDDVNGLTGNGAAVRGNIAILAWNTMTAQVWGEKEYTADGIVYGPLTNPNGTKKTLLSQGYRDFVDANGNMKYYEDVEVIGATLFGDDVDTDEMVIKYTGISAALSKTGYYDIYDYDAGDSADDQNADKAAAKADQVKLEVKVPGLDLNALVGKYCDVMLDKDNKVVFVKESKTKTLMGLVDDLDKANGKVEVNDIKYSAPSTVTVNGLPMTFAQACDMIDDSKAMAIIIKDDNDSIKTVKLVVADAIDAEEVADGNPATITLTNIANGQRTGATFSIAQGVVKEIKNDKVYDLNDDVLFDIEDVTDEDGDKDNIAVITKNNKPATAEDIKEGDVITYTKSTLFSSKVVNWIVVTDNKIPATVTKISGDEDAANNDERYVLTVGDKKIEMVNDGTAKMTSSGDLDDCSEITDSITDFLNKEATLYLNALGEIVLVSGTVSASAAGEVGVVSKTMWDDTDSEGDTIYYVQILTAKGEKKSYVVKDEIFMDADGASLSAATEIDINLGADATRLDAGEVVRYTLNSDNTISGKNLYLLSSDFEDDGKDIGVKIGYVLDADTNKDAKTIKIGGTTYFVNSSTVFFNRNTGTDLLDTLSGWDNLHDMLDEDLGDPVLGNNDVAVNEPYVIYDKNNMVKAVIFDFDDITSIGGSNKYGIFVEKYSTTDDQIVTILVNGEEVEYEVASSVYSKLAAGDFIKYELNGSGKYTNVNDEVQVVDKSYVLDLDDTEAYEIDSVKVSDRIVTFEDGRAVKLDTDVVVYDVSGDTFKVASVSDLAAGMLVAAPDEDAQGNSICDEDNDGMLEYVIIIKK